MPNDGGRVNRPTQRVHPFVIVDVIDDAATYPIANDRKGLDGFGFAWRHHFVARGHAEEDDFVRIGHNVDVVADLGRWKVFMDIISVNGPNVQDGRVVFFYRRKINGEWRPVMGVYDDPIFVFYVEPAAGGEISSAMALVQGAEITGFESSGFRFRMEASKQRRSSSAKARKSFFAPPFDSTSMGSIKSCESAACLWMDSL